MNERSTEKMHDKPFTGSRGIAQDAPADSIAAYPHTYEPDCQCADCTLIRPAPAAATPRFIVKGGIRLLTNGWSDDVLADYFERGWELVEAPAACGCACHSWDVEATAAFEQHLDELDAEEFEGGYPWPNL